MVVLVVWGEDGTYVTKELCELIVNSFMKFASHGREAFTNVWRASQILRNLAKATVYKLEHENKKIIDN